MKVIHVVSSFHPDAVGGAEIHVEALAHALQGLGIESMVCAPGEPAAYRHGTLRLRRFAGDPSPWTVESSYEPDPVSGEAFGAILDEERPALVHLHCLNRAVSSPLVREIKRRDVALALTYHDCSMTCSTHDLRRFGRTDCDGRLDASRCAACLLHRRGVPVPVASAIGRVPASWGRLMARSGIAGRFATVMRMRELVERRHAATRYCLHEADAVVAPAEWVRELLLLNGVPAGRIVVSLQGIVFPTISPGPTSAEEALPIRIACFARLDPRKGLHVLVTALAREPALPITLDLYLVRQHGDDSYLHELESRASRDRRIRLLPSIPHSHVVRTMSRYQALAVPSQVPETGPLVALEALCAGIPVLASRTLGICDQVVPERNGLLASPCDAEGWARLLRRIATEEGVLQRLASGVVAPRDMGSVAAQLGTLYRELVHSARRGPNGDRARPAEGGVPTFRTVPSAK